MRGPTESGSTPSAAAHPPDAAPAAAASADQYTAIQQSADFQELRSTYRRFVFPVTGGALAFYFTYVICAAYAPGFMSQTISGNVNVGLVFGLLQFVMVFAITTYYVKFARTVLDPAAEKVRESHRLDQETAR